MFMCLVMQDQRANTGPVLNKEDRKRQKILKLIKRPCIMTTNKQTVTRYIEGFRNGDHEMVLSCLTDNVLWEMPGYYQLAGKGAFDREMEDDAFEGNPDITVIRLIEEDDIVVAEGKVQSKRKDGGLLDAVFCDVFHMENGKIRQLTSYLMENKVSIGTPGVIISQKSIRSERRAAGSPFLVIQVTPEGLSAQALADSYRFCEYLHATLQPYYPLILACAHLRLLVGACNSKLP